MTLSATVTAETGSVSPKTSPDSITTVQAMVRPYSEGAWTTSAPYVLYTAPTTCKYARIVIRQTGKKSTQSYQNESFRLESDGSHNYRLGLAIQNSSGSATEEILQNYSGNTSFELHLNCFGQTMSNQTNFMMPFNMGPFDVVCAWQNNSNQINYSVINGDRFVLNPGEKFVGTTGNNTLNRYIQANFQAWVYN